VKVFRSWVELYGVYGSIRCNHPLETEFMTSITIEIPESLMFRIQASGQPTQAVVLQAIEQYLEDQSRSMPQHTSKTWELCGTLEISQPEAQYIVGQNEQKQAITNYAEHVDEVLNR
jgi:hypothetical protein